jgi:ParB family chromosome partitioning protein
LIERPKRGLGRGLDALLPAAAPPRATSGESYGEGAVFVCAVERIGPQRGQPRQHFDEAALAELTASILEHGMVQPIVVRRTGGASGEPHRDRFEIIAGERRWRAAQRAGLREVMVVVKDVSPKAAFELAIVENLQREDLDPIEIAEAYQRLAQEHGYSQETIAARVGKDRSTVANALRLLKLPARVRQMVVQRELSEGHARALLGAPDEKVLADLAEKVVRGRLPVRELERLVREARARAEGKASGKAEGGSTAGGAQRAGKSAAVRDLEARLARRLGTRVEVRDVDGSGELAIHYGSLDELDRVLGLLGA